MDKMFTKITIEVDRDVLENWVNSTRHHLKKLLDEPATPKPILNIYLDSFKQGNDILIKNGCNHWEKIEYEILKHKVEKYN